MGSLKCDKCGCLYAVGYLWKAGDRCNDLSYLNGQDGPPCDGMVCVWMTKAELLKWLWQCKEVSTRDQQVAHSDADSGLLMFINDTEIAEAYEAAVGKWCAESVS